MDLQKKLSILADAAKYDASCASSGSYRPRPSGGVGNSDGTGICHSYTPDGRCVSLLKILLTNFCIYDCIYCINRTTSDTPRARFTPEEVVRLTLDFYRRNYIEGLFLSSGIIQSPDYTMEQLIAVARQLRIDHGFGGYIHLKAAAGVSRELLSGAGLYADRVSVNIEVPTPSDLVRIAPAKSHTEIEAAMSTIRSAELAKEERPPSQRLYLPAGQSTQMMVGATPATDAQILNKASQLYRNYRLRRVYYSAFSPIPFADSRLPAKPAPLLREHRLYQADWLVRFYGFDADEITTEADPNLSLDRDPKLAWALRNRHLFPIDVNRAPREMLLRVPGFGVRTVQQLLQSRRIRAVTLDTLGRLNVRLAKACPWIKTADRNPGNRSLDSVDLVKSARPHQLNLFAAEAASQG